jgi:hypothetical protein
MQDTTAGKVQSPRPRRTHRRTAEIGAQPATTALPEHLLQCHVRQVLTTQVKALRQTPAHHVMLAPTAKAMEQSLRLLAPTGGGAVQERSLQCRLPSTARKVISALEALRPLAHLVSTRMNSARQSAKSAPPATNARARTKPLWNAARCTTVQLLKQIPPSAQTANTQRKRLPRSWTIAFNARPDTFVMKARLTRRDSPNVM